MSGRTRPAATVDSLDVLHIDLQQIQGTAGPQQPALVVFWWSDWPVGQTRTKGGEALSILRQRGVSEDVLQRVREAGESAPGLASKVRPPTSIVICTRDRPDELARCLASLPLQTLIADQVVVVDNASKTARTREVALAAGVTYVREDRPGLDIARNTGALAATGDIVCYTDDDVRLHPRWLERMVDAFDAPQVMAVTGLVLPAELATPAQLHFETYWSFGRGYRRIDFGPEFFATDRRHGCHSWEVGAGASMAFRRETFARVGLFDERLDVGAAGCSGDSEYWHRVLSRGYTCRYEPSAVVHHYHRRDFPGLAYQVFSYMRGHAAALLVQYERTGNWGNLRRLLFTMPAWYGRRALRRLVRGRSDGDRLLPEEFRGFCSGILFYLRAPRPSDQPAK